MNITSDQWTAALKAVMKKASTDGDFRAKCLRDPIAAVKEAADLDLPDDTKIRFVEKREEQVFVLPPFGGSDELSDEDLAKASGGFTMMTGFTMCRC